MLSSRAVAALASASLRLTSLCFLRVFPIPGLLPAIGTLFAIYLTAFIQALRRPSTYVLIKDTVDVTIKEPTEIGLDDEAAESKPLVAEVDAQETVAVVDKPPSLLSVLLGAPSPRYLGMALISFAINLGFVLSSVDFVYRGHFFYPSDDLSFVRLGYVSHDEARFLLREPDQAHMPISFQLHIKEPHAATDDELWQTVSAIDLTGNDTDFTATLTVPLPHAEQRVYEWKTSNGHSGEFVSPPKPGALSQLNDGKFTFLSTSCILPHFPYSPLDHPLSIPGMRHLAKLLPDLGAQFMLFLGDFIYVDVPLRLGSQVVDYRKKYRQAYASPEWATVGQNLSWIHVLDDHEIANDWSSNSTGLYSTAIDPFVHYHAQVNPPPPKRIAAKGVTQHQARYFEFTQGPASFFLADTRSFRSPNELPANSTSKTMLGAEQLDELIYWLSRPEPKGVKWKIIASSVPFTKNWPVNNGDTWGGFLEEREKVLEAMWDAGASGFGVVVLSGDRHEFAATKFPPPEDGRWPESATPHEFSASPLNQFASPVPTYKQLDEQDVPLKYIHSGRSKFGALTIEMLKDGRLSSLKYSLFVDGEEAWSTTVLSPESEEVEEVEVKKKSFWSMFGL